MPFKEMGFFSGTFELRLLSGRLALNKYHFRTCIFPHVISYVRCAVHGQQIWLRNTWTKCNLRDKIFALNVTGETRSLP